MEKMIAELKKLDKKDIKKAIIYERTKAATECENDAKVHEQLARFLEAAKDFAFKENRKKAERCIDCSACQKGFFESKPDDYVCIGVQEPFVIKNIYQKCPEYSK